MRLCILSDIHLEFRPDILTRLTLWPGNENPYTGLSAFGFSNKIDADMLVMAGDIHPKKGIRDKVKSALEGILQMPVLIVEGNHDSYGSDFPALGANQYLWEFAGLKFAGATLWTELTDKDALVRRQMADFHTIRDISIEKWNDAHRADWEFLKTSGADVIITHHGPTPRHIHPKYQGAVLNPFFSSDLAVDEASNCKLWISGHTHTPFDFVERGIRFVVNPLGYPGENPDADLKFVDI